MGNSQSIRKVSFEENVRMTEAENELQSDYLDAIASESFLTAYNNVKFSNDESIGFADKVKVDLTTKLSQISMYDGEEKIYIISHDQNNVLT